LHSGPKEPGFYQNLHLAYQLASDRLGEKPSVSLYKALHKCACAHFKGETTSTDCGADKAGLFRDNSPVESRLGKMHLTVETEENYRNSHILKIIQEAQEEESPSKGEDIDALRRSASYVKKYEGALPERVEGINDSIEKLSRSLGASKPLAKVAIESHGVLRILYQEVSREEMEAVMDRLFDNFNKDMERLSSPKDKLKRIAALYQHLEWIHPCYDGTGRTDLIMLNKLLSENGFNPAILEKPYMCIFSPFQDWLSYLEKGMENWQRLQSAPKVRTSQKPKKAPSSQASLPKPKYRLISRSGVVYKKKLTGFELFFSNLFKKS
jgi:hypothetical protein